jgi:hypothetical protein
MLLDLSMRSGRALLPFDGLLLYFDFMTVLCCTSCHTLPRLTCSVDLYLMVMVVPLPLETSCC